MSGEAVQLQVTATMSSVVAVVRVGRSEAVFIVIDLGAALVEGYTRM
jgi:hypothetical protein